MHKGIISVKDFEIVGICKFFLFFFMWKVLFVNYIDLKLLFLPSFFSSSCSFFFLSRLMHFSFSSFTSHSSSSFSTAYFFLLPLLLPLFIPPPLPDLPPTHYIPSFSISLILFIFLLFHCFLFLLFLLLFHNFFLMNYLLFCPLLLSCTILILSHTQSLSYPLSVTSAPHTALLTLKRT